MPKYTIDLTKIAAVDNDRFSDTFSRLNFLSNSGIIVSPGFVIGFEAFEDNFGSTLANKVKEVLSVTGNLPDQTSVIKSLHKSLLSQAKLPPDLKNEINRQLKNLKPPYLIRAVVKDPNQKESVNFEEIVNNSTSANEAVVSAWLAFLSKDYLGKINLNSLEKIAVAVCVTEKNLAEVSGRAYILSGQEDLVEIQSLWGEYNPLQKTDSTILVRKTLEEKGYQISPQKTQLVFSQGKYVNLPIAEKFQTERKITAPQASAIASALKKIQSIALSSVELSFEIVDNKIYVNEINFNIEKGKKSESLHIGIDLPSLVSLKPLVPGIAAGISKFINKPSDLKKLKLGDIAVVSSFQKEYLPHLKKASGLIIQSSKKFSAEALPLVNSLGIATVVGNIKNLSNQVITLNGKTGKVYKGAFAPLQGSRLEVAKTKEESPKVLKTATKIFVSSNTDNFSTLNPETVDGVGPIRPELFFTRFGIHPKELLNKSQFHQVADAINSHFAALCKLMGDKPVIYQLSDFKSQELLHLNQGLLYETPETNPFLGKRGAFRHLQNPNLLEAELTIIKTLRNKEGFKNLWVSLSFIRTKKELIELKKLVSRIGLNRSPSFKLLMTISTPANIYSIDELISEGIDGFLIDYYDLANLVYGKDFSYAELTSINDSALDSALTEVLKPLAKNKLFSGIYNFPIEKSPELFRKVVGLGIKSISVSEKSLTQARSDLAAAEKQLVGKK